MSVAILLVVFAVLAVIVGVTMPWIGESLYESEDEIDAMLEERECERAREREGE